MDTHYQLVRFALALHLQTRPTQLELHHRLGPDLGLDPLDLVLVALRLEELEDVEFPVADLERVETVGDLVELVRNWRSPDRAATLPPPPPFPPAPAQNARKVSGIQPILTHESHLERHRARAE